MNKILVVFAILTLLLPLGLGHSFAQKTWEVRIHTGAADPHAPVFLVPAEPLNIEVGDSVEWGNGDTVPHEIVSGTPEAGPDGKFDTGLLQPGQLFSHTFTDVGTISYYDKNYPFIKGVVNVQLIIPGFKVISGVGSDAGDGKRTFDVQYSSVKDIISAVVKQKEKSVTFTLVGKANGSNTLVLKLPNNLVGTPFIGVWVDHQVTDAYKLSSEGGINTVTIPLQAASEEVSIVGTTIVPEFGPIVGLIMVLAIVATITLVKFRPIQKLG